MSNPLRHHPTLGFFIHSQNPSFFRFFRTSQVFPIASRHLRRRHTVTTSHYCQSESSTHPTTRFFHPQSKPLIFSLFSDFPGVSHHFPPPPPPSHCDHKSLLPFKSSSSPQLIPPPGFFIHCQNPSLSHIFRASQVFPITFRHLRRCHTVSL
jgi:hypothetical protein